MTRTWNKKQRRPKNQLRNQTRDQNNDTTSTAAPLTKDYIVQYQETRWRLKWK